MDKIKKKQWEESYKRNENFIFSPKEEVVKFLNRFVKKRIGFDNFINLLGIKEPIKGLDFGCGIGAQTRLMYDFGIEAYGIDISENAINEAKEISKLGGYSDLSDNFLVYDGEKIPFEDNFFDICICESVLDSMYFALAKTLIKEIDRVTKKFCFISLISGDNDKYFREYSEDVLVQEEHENGTIQSYYNYTKVNELIKETNFKIKWCRLVEEHGVDHRYKYGRYYIVLEK